MTWDRLALALGAIICAAHCSDSGTDGACEDSDDCDTGFVCESSTCRCRSDQACGNGRVCNPFGTCQLGLSCLGNRDCGADEICSSSSGTGGVCISAGRCRTSVDCRLGERCDGSTERCVVGCDALGDCPLGQICVSGSCISGQSDGECERCPDDSDVARSAYCDFGDVCDAGSQSCEAHPEKADLCRACNNDRGELCPDGMVCSLEPDAEVPGDGYCATGCETVDDCPSGYQECTGLSLVIDACDDATPCANGGRCLGRTETREGFCECIERSDCSGIYDQELPDIGALCQNGVCVLEPELSCTSGIDCSCRNRECLATGTRCENAADCALDCVQVRVGDGTFGQCQTRARVCIKPFDVSCQELTGEPGNPLCRGVF